MSRVGKAPITLPKGVSFEQKGAVLTVKGPKGTLSQTFHPDMGFDLEDGVVTVSRPSESRDHRSLHGLSRSLLNNMILGVSEGFTKILEVEGVGYRAEMKGSTLVLNVGYSHPIEFVPAKDMSFAVENRGKEISVSGLDKQLVGEISAQIRKTRPPEPYKGKGIHYRGEQIRRKAGKTGKV